uniref:RAB3GAP2_N domain-containing protein n=1 Tax=Panagrellus redivivus TaxID=6233 RepID=A0A7E4VNC6_PANRE
MWCSLHESATLVPEQITRVNAFLTEDGPIVKASGQKRYEAGDDDSIMSEVEDAEKPAGVDSWTPTPMEVDSSQPSDADTNLVRSADDSRWLTQTLFGASNTLDVMAYAYTNRIVVLVRPPNHTKYEVSAMIHVTDNINPEEDYITCIHVLPVASTRKSETTAYDWTCVIVALSNGFVNFYTERGIFIYFEQVAHGFISNVRFGASSLKSKQSLVFLSRDRLAVIDGGSLFKVLCKARMAVARNEGKTIAEISGGLSLVARNLRFHGVRRIFDFALIGPSRYDFFEQLVDVCMKDPHRRIEYATPRVDNYFLLSRNMFGAFVHHDFYTVSTSTMDAVNDMAAILTAKVTSYVPSVGFRSFFGLGTSKRDLPNKNPVNSAKQETATIRQLCIDNGRLGDRVFVAGGGWKIMAVADDSARILVLDTETRRIVRIFKGYRNARCAFVEASGTVKDHQKELRALFLVIFAPKRGLLEVWAMQNGPRVSAFNVDPRGRLLSLPDRDDGILGRPVDGNALYRQTVSGAIFVDSDGHVFTLVAPFRLAARGAHEVTMHDENLIREFTTLKFVNTAEENTIDLEKLTTFVTALKTFPYKKKSVEAITRSRHFSVDSILATMTALLKVTAEQIDTAMKPNPENLSFYRHLQLMINIIKLYKLLRNHWQREALHSFEKSLEDLKLVESEIEAANLHLLHEASSGTTFTMPPLPSLRMFIDQFDLNVTVGSVDTPIDELPFAPKEASGKEAVLIAIFAPFIFGNVDQGELLDEVLPMLGCSKEAFIVHIVEFWLITKNTHPLDFTDRIVHLLRQISSTITRTVLLDIEGRVKESTNVLAGYCLLTAIRALHRWEIAERGIEADTDAGVDAFDVDDEWEQMDEYVEYCDLLARHLVTLSLIAALPSPQVVSLKGLCDKGPGYYREKVGAWYATTKDLPYDRFIYLINKDVPEVVILTLPERLLDALVYALPKTLLANFLLVDCVWEATSFWYRDESRRAASLTNATILLQNLNLAPRLQHGTALMLWDTFVVNPFRALYRHFNSNDGQPPKDPGIRRNVLVAEVDLLEFVSAVERLLRAMIYALTDLENQPALDVVEDDFVKRLMDYVFLRPNSTATNRLHRATLVEMAAKHKPVTHSMALNHLHLVVATKLRLMCSIQIAPAYLFDTQGRRALFEPLQSHPLVPLARVESRLIAGRQRFLEECITNVVANESTDVDLHDFWRIVMELAEDWELDTENLRIREAVVLYEHGLDNKVIPVTIMKKVELAHAMIPIIIGRVRHFLNETPTLYREIERRHVASRTTLDYVQSFDDAPMPSFEVKPDHTNRLISQAKQLFQYAKPDDNAVKNKLRILSDLVAINVFLVEWQKRGNK